MLIANVKQTEYTDPQHAMVYFPVRRESIADIPTLHDFLHITLIYIGTVNEIADILDVRYLLEELAMLGVPKAKVAGVARFNGDSTDGGNPFVLLVDSKDIFAYRARALDLVPDYSNHGYIPHITLSTLDREEAMPFDAVEEIELDLPWICYAEGENHWCLQIESVV